VRRILAVAAVAVVALLAGPAWAAGATIHVSPTSVPAGGTVTVSGSVPGCQVGDQVTLISKAFVQTHDFAGLPAIFTPVRAGGTFSATTRIPGTKTPGTYGVTGRCGGGNLGVEAVLRVRAAAAGLPFTGASTLPELAVGFGLVGVGGLVLRAARRRRSA
jgi:hypothetical protein